LATQINKTIDISEIDTCYNDFMNLNKSLTDKIYSLKQQHRQYHMIVSVKGSEKDNIERDIYFLRNILISSVFYSCCIDNTIGHNKRAYDFLIFYKTLCEKISPQMYMFYLLEILLSAFYLFRSLTPQDLLYIDNIRVECCGLLKIYYSSLRDSSNPLPDRYSFMEVLFSDLITK
jgi:hypothetical protein